MPVEWTISHRLRLVVGVSKGEIRPQDMIDFLERVDAEGARPYAKIFSVDDLRVVYSDESVRGLANLVRRREEQSRVGPIAIVASGDDAWRQARLFADVARLVRPIAVFREWHEARRWVDQQAGSAGAAEPVAQPPRRRA